MFIELNIELLLQILVYTVFTTKLALPTDNQTKRERLWDEL